MNLIKKYVNSMYPPAYITLCIGFALFTLSILALAMSMRAEMLAGEVDLIYRYPKMLEEALFPMLILMPVVLGIDLNERKKKSRQ